MYEHGEEEWEGKEGDKSKKPYLLGPESQIRLRNCGSQESLLALLIVDGRKLAVIASDCF